MKKSFLILFFVLTSWGHTIAQTGAIRFPNPAYWRVDASDSDPGPPACSGTYYYDYFTGADTLIGSNFYVKITRSSYVAAGATPCYYASIAPGYVGALRDDTIAKKVFFVYASQNTDSLLFDYNWIVGDTIKGILAPLFSSAFITSIDSIVIGSQYHKRWHLNYCFIPSFYFIEGIGSYWGLIDHFDCGGGVGYNLICVMDSTGTIYSGSTSPYGCQLVGINESKGRTTLAVYPNPFAAELVISGEEYYKDVTINLFSTLGQKIYSSIRSFDRETQIHIPDLDPGVYLVTLESDSGTILSRRVIKTQ